MTLLENTQHIQVDPTPFCAQCFLPSLSNPSTGSALRHVTVPLRELGQWVSQRCTPSAVDATETALHNEEQAWRCLGLLMGAAAYAHNHQKPHRTLFPLFDSASIASQGQNGGKEEDGTMHDEDFGAFQKCLSMLSVVICESSGGEEIQQQRSSRPSTSSTPTTAKTSTSWSIQRLCFSHHRSSRPDASSTVLHSSPLRVPSDSPSLQQAFRDLCHAQHVHQVGTTKATKPMYEDESGLASHTQAQEVDVRCIGWIVQTVFAHPQLLGGGSYSSSAGPVVMSRCSSELTFLLKRIATTPPASGTTVGPTSSAVAATSTSRPTATQIVRLSSVRTRLVALYLEQTVIAETERHRLQAQTAPPVLSSHLAKGAAPPSNHPHQADNGDVKAEHHGRQDELQSREEAVRRREVAVAERESKMAQFLSLYDLTQRTLDSLPIHERSTDELKRRLLMQSKSNNGESKEEGHTPPSASAPTMGRRFVMTSPSPPPSASLSPTPTAISAESISPPRHAGNRNVIATTATTTTNTPPRQMVAHHGTPAVSAMVYRDSDAARQSQPLQQMLSSPTMQPTTITGNAAKHETDPRSSYPAPNSSSSHHPTPLHEMPSPLGHGDVSDTDESAVGVTVVTGGMSHRPLSHNHHHAAEGIYAQEAPELPLTTQDPFNNFSTVPTLPAPFFYSSHPKKLPPRSPPRPFSFAMEHHHPAQRDDDDAIVTDEFVIEMEEEDDAEPRPQRFLGAPVAGSVGAAVGATTTTTTAKKSTTVRQELERARTPPPVEDETDRNESIEFPETTATATAAAGGAAPNRRGLGKHSPVSPPPAPQPLNFSVATSVASAAERPVGGTTSAAVTAPHPHKGNRRPMAATTAASSSSRLYPSSVSGQPPTLPSEYGPTGQEWFNAAALNNHPPLDTSAESHHQAERNRSFEAQVAEVESLQYQLRHPHHNRSSSSSPYPTIQSCSKPPPHGGGRRSGSPSSQSRSHYPFPTEEEEMLESNRRHRSHEQQFLGKVAWGVPGDDAGLYTRRRMTDAVYPSVGEPQRRLEGTEETAQRTASRTPGAASSNRRQPRPAILTTTKEEPFRTLPTTTTTTATTTGSTPIPMDPAEWKEKEQQEEAEEAKRLLQRLRSEIQL